MLLVSPALGQDGKGEKTAEKREKEIPKPEDFVLSTSDGVQLAVTYYPGPVYPSTKTSKSFPSCSCTCGDKVATSIRTLRRTCRVWVTRWWCPNLRGHGESTHPKGARTEDLIAEKMSAQQLPLMATEDMMTVKTFLWDRNNAGELNIDKLCIVGAEMGALGGTELCLGRRPATRPEPGLWRRPRVQARPFRESRGAALAGALRSTACRSSRP